MPSRAFTTARTHSNSAAIAETLGFTPISSNGTVSTANALATARTIALAGDASGSTVFDGSANASITVSLANSGVTAGAYTNANVTVDAKGRITAVSNGAAGGGGTLSTITLSGDASGTSSNTGNLAVTLANSGVAAGTYGSSSAVPVITVDVKGRITNVSTQISSGLAPVGSILFSPSSTAPEGYVSANGAIISNSTYPSMNAAISAGSALRISGDVWVINVYGGQTAPAGTTYSASSILGAGNEASKAFDGSVNAYTGCWHSAAGLPAWYRVTFASPVQLNKWDWQKRDWSNDNNGYPINWTLSGSNDGGVTKTLLYTKTSDTYQPLGSWSTHTFSNDVGYTTYQMDITSTTGGTYAIIGELRVGTIGNSSSYYLPNSTGAVPSGMYAYVKVR